MAVGKYRVPNELKDEDKWGYGRLKFTKVQLFYILAGVAAGIFIWSLFGKIGLSVLGALIGILVAGIICAIGIIPIPKSNYTKGGGYPLSTIVFRILYRRLNRKIYIKNYKRN